MVKAFKFCVQAIFSLLEKTPPPPSRLENLSLRIFFIILHYKYPKKLYTAISIKVVHKQSGKVEYERERLLGIANKLMNFQSDSQQPFTLVFDFSALLVDNLN
jgi:hypothetical protein